jgi:hypothetical protein
MDTWEDNSGVELLHCELIVGVLSEVHFFLWWEDARFYSCLTWWRVLTACCGLQVNVFVNYL